MVSLDLLVQHQFQHLILEQTQHQPRCLRDQYNLELILIQPSSYMYIFRDIGQIQIETSFFRVQKDYLLSKLPSGVSDQVFKNIRFFPLVLVNTISVFCLGNAISISQVVVLGCCYCVKRRDRVALCLASSQWHLRVETIRCIRTFTFCSTLVEVGCRLMVQLNYHNTLFFL